jgi:hypothetical protein
LASLRGLRPGLRWAFSITICDSVACITCRFSVERADNRPVFSYHIPASPHPVKNFLGSAIFGSSGASRIRFHDILPSCRAGMRSAVACHRFRAPQPARPHGKAAASRRTPHRRTPHRRLAQVNRCGAKMRPDLPRNSRNRKMAWGAAIQCNPLKRFGIGVETVRDPGMNSVANEKRHL